MSKTCPWLRYKKLDFLVSCNEWQYELTSMEWNTYNYCPFCGRQIEWRDAL